MASQNNTPSDEQLAGEMKRPVFMVKRKRILDFGLNKLEKEWMESEELKFMIYLKEEAKLSYTQISLIVGASMEVIKGKIRRFRNGLKET